MNIKDIKDKAKVVKDKIAKVYANKYVTKERTLRDFVETAKIDARILWLTFLLKNYHDTGKDIDECLVVRGLWTKTGRRMLGEAMVEPIRRSLDYAGIGRKLLMVDELPEARTKAIGLALETKQGREKLAEELSGPMENAIISHWYDEMVNLKSTKPLDDRDIFSKEWQVTLKEAVADHVKRRLQKDEIKKANKG